MYVTVVYVKVLDNHIDDFIQACEKNHSASIKEEGNCRFDILQQTESTTDFILYEAYQSAEHAAAHKETEHYLQWRKTVADWMAEPRQGVQYNGLYPATE